MKGHQVNRSSTTAEFFNYRSPSRRSFGPVVSHIKGVVEEGDHVHYVVEQMGDIEGTDVFHSLEEALRFIEKTFREIDSDDVVVHVGGPDPEDDRILIWEVAPNNEAKVVWHFSGWHWDQEAEDLVPDGMDQGRLLGHAKSLYEEVMEHY